MSSELNVPMGSPAPGASERGADGGGMDYRDWVRRSYLELVSSNHHSVQALSWRKLYLSRAKLKASSRTSALLSGFAMVSPIHLLVQHALVHLFFMFPGSLWFWLISSKINLDLMETWEVVGRKWFLQFLFQSFTVCCWTTTCNLCLLDFISSLLTSSYWFLAMFEHLKCSYVTGCFSHLCCKNTKRSLTSASQMWATTASFCGSVLCGRWLYPWATVAVENKPVRDVNDTRSAELSLLKGWENSQSCFLARESKWYLSEHVWLSQLTHCFKQCDWSKSGDHLS